MNIQNIQRGHLSFFTTSVALSLLIACGDDSDSSEALPLADADANADASNTQDSGVTEDDTSTPMVAETLGLTQYWGRITPIPEPPEGDAAVFSFDINEGPICMRGAQFRTSVRETPSEDLVIFMQGGGACWSTFCLAVTGAPAGVPRVDILNPELEANPVRDWDVVYLPYCDGSFFSGDSSIDDNINDKGTRHHRGLANLTAALEVAALKFPSPRRVLLAGSSGGAYGLILGTPLVRHYYPDAELLVIADSGVGLGKDGDNSFVETIMEEFDLARFLPDDCPDCLARGHLTGLIGYYLERDENLKIAMFSSWYDSILANVFLQVPAESFAESLKRETDLIASNHPDRFRRFIIDGKQHTALLGDPSGIIGTDFGAVEIPQDIVSTLLGDLELGGLETTSIDGVTVSEWLFAFVNGNTEGWVEKIEARTPLE